MIKRLLQAALLLMPLFFFYFPGSAQIATGIMPTGQPCEVTVLFAPKYEIKNVIWNWGDGTTAGNGLVAKHCYSGPSRLVYLTATVVYICRQNVSDCPEQQDAVMSMTILVWAQSGESFLGKVREQLEAWLPFLSKVFDWLFSKGLIKVIGS